MTEQQLRELTAELGGEDGWWKSSTEETVYEAAKALAQHGFDTDAAREFLEALITAVRGEYGD